MGLVLYIADYIEPNRMHLDDGDRASLLGEPTLEALCIRILEAESMHLRSKGKEITHSGLALRTLLKEGGRL
jgi:HD superfamily phosphohydrolase YqeK